MRSNSPFRQDKCATGWAKLKEGYLKKEGGAAEYKREKPDYHCNESTNYKVEINDNKDDADQPTFIKEKKTSMADEKQQSK
tara:strand:- start:57 stop:299 length:243 start_codon:yes stop_codon:yes gene_type:complete